MRIDSFQLVFGHICLSLELEECTVGGQNVFVLGFFFEGGGGGDLAERNLGRKPPENF